MSYLDPYQRDLAIRTLYGEADGDASAEAVAHSIRNRQLAGRYGGSEVEGVVNKPYAYEARQPGSEARKRMDSLNPDSDEYRRNAEIVDKVWSGNTPDPTNGATHFLAPKLQSDLGRPRPSWAPEGGGQMHGTQEFFAPEGRVARPGDAEGPPEAPKAPMATAFSAQSTRPQAQPQPQQQQAPRPALSTQNVMGGGALTPGAEPQEPKGPAWLEELKNRSMADWGQRLERVGMQMSDSPQVRAAAAAMGNKSSKKYDFINVNGKIYRTDAATGQVTPAGGEAEPSAGDKAYEVETAKGDYDYGAKITASANKAQSMLGDVNLATQLSKDPSVYQGPGGALTLEAKKAFNASGLGQFIGVKNFEGNERAEMLQALANRTTIGLRNGAGEGGVLAGSVSDKDLAFLKDSNFGLDKTPPGNQKILDYGRRVAERQIQIENMRQEYLKTNKRTDAGFQRQVSAFVNANPLFPEADVAPASPAAPSLPKGVRSITLIPN